MVDFIDFACVFISFCAHHKNQAWATFGIHWKLAKWMISQNAENIIKPYLKSKISVAPKLSDGRFYWFRIGFISKIEKLKIANVRSELPPQLAIQYVKMRNAKKCSKTNGFSTISYVYGATVPMLYGVFINFALVFMWSHDSGVPTGIESREER